jgi:DNA-binding XRE family transcriptional regulator
MTHFGQLLRSARKRAMLTQQELAMKIGIHHSYISKIEKEDYLPSVDVAVALAEALGMSDHEEFLSAARPLKGFKLVKAEDSKAKEEEEQGKSSLLDSDRLAATGTFDSPSSLVDNQGQQLPSFAEQMRQILTSANLPYAKRMIAQQMGLESFRIICWGLKEAE